MTILVTGSEGLIGRHLVSSLEAHGLPVRRFDIARTLTEDVRHDHALRQAVDGVSGVIILAAVSRVIWAENDPARCISTNVGGLTNILKICLEQKNQPWVMFASSREVYGEADEFPVREDMAMKPVNLYARSKVEGERLVHAARDAGLTANIFRLSSVYGCPLDHPDRVAMAFAGAARNGGDIRIDGGGNILDFTFVQDVIAGLMLLTKATAAGESLPPIHFVSGKGTTLAELAQLACLHSPHILSLQEAPPRNFDVAHFIGDPSRAEKLLGWKAKTNIHDGLSTLISRLTDYRRSRTSPALLSGVA